MSHALVTVLVTLSLPALAFAVILVVERNRKEAHEGLPDPAGENGAAPEFEVSEQPKPAADVPAEEPYREKAG